jgi:AraC-like DNA-binding protein
MDILSEVVDALQLKAVSVERSNLAADRREALEAGEALLVIVADGRCSARTAIGDTPLELHDDLLLVGAQVADFRSAGAPARVLRCRYSLQTALPHPLARQLPQVTPLSSHDLTARAELGRALELLESELANARFGSEFVAVRLAEIGFVEALRRRQLAADSEPAFLAALADVHVRASLALIHGSPNRAWRVTELAAGAGLSRAAFAERFHKRVGEPPLRYLRVWRLLAARRELASSGAPVREVAKRAGYRSANGFSRAFRRLFGHSPGASRRGRSSGAALVAQRIPNADADVGVIAKHAVDADVTQK